jgi:hypothetical protein
MTIRLDGVSLTRAQLVQVARGEGVELDEASLPRVSRAADFLAAQVAREEPIYGVSTGFGSNADKLLGAHPLRDELPGATRSGQSPHIELQRNLIVTHAVCVGEPFAPDVVRAMLCIRINTLLRGHSGIRVQTLQALAAMLNAGIVPVVPQLGSVGASGDLAPLSHLAIVLLGGGEAFVDGERVAGAEALRRKGLQPVTLSYKEGLALNNGTAQMLATGVLAVQQLEDLLDTADLAAAMTIDAFAGRLGAFAQEVHAASAPGPSEDRRQPAAPARWLHAVRHRLSPGAAFPAVVAVELGYSRRAGAELRHRLGLGAVRPAPWPREVLSALPAVPRRQESTSRRTAIRCVASRRSTARCAMRWRRPSACSTSSSMRSPTTRWCSPTSRPSMWRSR